MHLFLCLLIHSLVRISFLAFQTILPFSYFEQNLALALAIAKAKAMSSVLGVPDPEKMYKKSQHRKNGSDELDVFEAAKYFSGASEMYPNGSSFSQKVGSIGKLDHLQEKQQQQRGSSRAGRFSLDMPMRSGSGNISVASQNHPLVMEKQQQIMNNIKFEKKKHKQPSSPGGKLAHFLNSLFSQTSSRKKKSKSTTTTQSAKDVEDQISPGWRRKRRSSISHFQSSSSSITTTTTTTTSAVDLKSVYSHSSSGFRTPPPYSYTPTKSYKDLRSYSDHQQIISITKQQQEQNHVKSANPEKKNHDLDYAWLDDKLKFAGQNLQSCKNGNRGGVVVAAEKIQANNWADRYLSEDQKDHQFRGFNIDVDDDGADSDSSSDLFELPNYDLDFYSSGLPVYETTNMDSIKRSAPIASAAR